MVSRMSAVALAAAMVAVVVTLPASEAALTCSQVYQSLLPCLGYLQSGGGGSPPRSCCGGISTLMTAAKTTLDRRTACGCLKSAAAGISGVNLDFAASIPKKCGVYVPYKISLSTNCNKVN